MTKDEALEKSIKHWEELSRKRNPDNAEIGPKYCALCEMFLDYDMALTGNPARCDGCPIYQRTGRPDCGGTPYDEAAAAWGSADWSLAKSREREHMKDFRESARQEVGFLKSLRTVQ